MVGLLRREAREKRGVEGVIGLVVDGEWLNEGEDGGGSLCEEPHGEKRAASGDRGGMGRRVGTAESLSARRNRSPIEVLGRTPEGGVEGEDERGGRELLGRAAPRSSEVSERTLRTTRMDGGGTSSSLSSSIGTGGGAARSADATAELGSRPAMSVEVCGVGVVDREASGQGEGDRARVRREVIERDLRTTFS